MSFEKSTIYAQRTVNFRFLNIRVSYHTLMKEVILFSNNLFLTSNVYTNLLWQGIGRVFYIFILPLKTNSCTHVVVEFKTSTFPFVFGNNSDISRYLFFL